MTESKTQVSERITPSLLVRNPLQEYYRILKLLSKGPRNKEELNLSYSKIRSKLDQDQVEPLSLKEFQTLINEMRGYDLIRFGATASEVSLGLTGKEFLEIVKDTKGDGQGLRELMLRLFFARSPKVLDFLLRLNEIKAIAFPRAPGAREFTSSGEHFSAQNSRHRRRYVEFCSKNTWLLLLTLRRDLPDAYSNIKRDELEDVILRYVEDVVSIRRSVGIPLSQSDIVERAGDAIKNYLIGASLKGVFTLSDFEIWQDRLFYLRVLNYSPSFPLFNGMLTFSITSTQEKPQGEFERMIVNDDQALYVHSPKWEFFRESFIWGIRGSFSRLYELGGLDYVRLADLRDLACYKLSIHDADFDEFMRELYRECNAGLTDVQMSFDSDIYPGRDHWKRRPLDLKGVAGKKTIVWVR